MKLITAHEYTQVSTRRGLVITLADEREDPFYIDEDQQAFLNECMDEASDQRLDMARMAFEAIPDVSVKAVADALGLSLFQVMSVSRGRNKAKRKGVNKGMEFNEYTREEILGAIDAATLKGWNF